MKTSLSSLALLCALSAAPLLTACGGGADVAASDDSIEAARKKKHHCQSNADCSNGQICVNNYCANPPPPPQCTKDSDCPAGDVCQGGKCVKGPPPPPQCTTDSDCPAGDVCQSGQCVKGPPPPPQCTTNSDCPAGDVCQSGQCVKGPPPPPAGGCSTNSDCGAGSSCVAGACYAQVVQPSSCAANGHGNPGLQAVVKITQYKGLDSNRLHELAVGTIVGDIWSTSSANITGGVDLAMRLGAGGLPNEIPLTVGQTIELEGFYIDPSANYSHDGNGVIHWTHSPCGYTVINGTKYQ